MDKRLRHLLETLDDHEALYIAASRAFETASEKMGTECPPAGTGPDGLCTTCGGSGTVGPSPLALAEWAQNGEIAELCQAITTIVDALDLVDACALCGMLNDGAHTLGCPGPEILAILAKIPGG